MKPSLKLLNYGNNNLPIIMQSEMTECGIASLTMIANYYGHKLDLSSVRRKYQISSKGATLQNLIQLADILQFNSRPVRLDLKDIYNLKTPAILHFDLNHFVVLKKVMNNRIIIHDPARGIRTLTLEEFSSHFTGVALEVSPMPDFKPEKNLRVAKFKDFWTKITGIKKILLQIFILSFMLQAFAMAAPFYMQIIVDDVIISQDFDLLLVLASGFGLLVLINTLVTAIRSQVLLYMGTQINMQMATNVLKHLIKLPMSYFEKRHIGSIVSRFGSIDYLKEILTNNVIESVVDGIMAVGLLLMMYIYSPLLTFIILFFIAMYTIIRIVSYRLLHQFNEEAIVTNAKQNTNFIESIKAIQSIKLFGNEIERLTLWQNLYADHVNANIKVGKLNIKFNVINDLIFGFENIIIIYLAAQMVLNNDISVGMLFAFVAYKTQFTTKASTLIKNLIQFKMLSLHMERLGDIVLSKKEKNLEGIRELIKVKGELKLNNIKFKYSENEPYILEDLNISIKQGSSVAITGPSGTGKTTLMKIMLGLLQPNSGTVKFDNFDINQIGLKSYRSAIATVMQDDQLLSGSIADNICFFQPNFDQKLIEDSANKAAIHHEIIKMPMGYHTLIGDMGSSLSGGQKQRLLLARALYKRPRILFLDEATSNLDVDLERRVNETITKLNITRIIIAHRPETIAMADYKLELSNKVLV